MKINLSPASLKRSALTIIRNRTIILLSSAYLLSTPDIPSPWSPTATSIPSKHTIPSTCLTSPPFPSSTEYYLQEACWKPSLSLPLSLSQPKSTRSLMQEIYPLPSDIVNNPLFPILCSAVSSWELSMDFKCPSLAPISNNCFQHISGSH